MKNPSLREQLFFCLKQALKDEGFFRSLLQEATKKKPLIPKDQALALELGHGVIKRKKTLLAWLKALSKSSLPKKAKEKTLALMGLYEIYFLEKVPRYATCNEYMKLAKKHTHPSFHNYLYSLLKNAPEAPPEDPLPLEEALSYPEYFVTRLCGEFGTEKTKELLEIGNISAKNFARLREKTDSLSLPSYKEHFLVLKGKDLQALAKSPSVYIQNPTPFFLVEHFLEKLNSIKSVLDLCASPGGKSLLLHDLLPQDLELTVNDLSEKKLEKLKENASKYSLPFSYTMHLGESYPEGKLFDLVVVDVPCSNSGTLNRKAEARWRLEKAHLDPLVQKQKDLLEHARKLVKPEGYLLYLSCSILPEENTFVIEDFLKENEWKRVKEDLLILPNKEGEDGGFASLLQKA